MKILAHITFYYDEERLRYLNTVISELLAIPEDIQIYIYSNRQFPNYDQYSNIKIFTYTFNESGYKRKGVARIGINRLVHPFFLTWMHRKKVKKEINNYDVQLYLEDDIEFTKDNLEYWLKYKDQCLVNGYNLGFLRREVDEDGKEYVNDLLNQLSKIIKLDDRHFVLNDDNPYSGFWIYDQKELKNFTKSREWRFWFKGYGIREMAAIGWHGLDMDRYKGTLIPVRKNAAGKFESVNGCSVDHLPNNYINSGKFCIIPFPLQLDEKRVQYISA